MLRNLASDAARQDGLALASSDPADTVSHQESKNKHRPSSHSVDAFGSSDFGARIPVNGIANQVIDVCICTYKRPAMLKRLLRELSRQETGGLFTYSIRVADNDREQSAEAVVAEFAATFGPPITYCVQPQQSIALTRNKAVENAAGDFVAFIDDDEFPDPFWLLNLFKACGTHGVDGAIGPVKRQFDAVPPQWVIKGNFYERPSYQTGLVLDWTRGRTNNVLIKAEMLRGEGTPFRPEFRTGEDQDFFRRMIEQGRVFIWCNEAVVYEVVPPIRWKRTFMLKRALLQGSASVLHPDFGARNIAKSLVAIPAYTIALPFALILGQHRFMSLLVKLADHIGKLAAVLKVNLIQQPYVTE
jgi:glycosyltransferase involved in cell wall biosynthesis